MKALGGTVALAVVVVLAGTAHAEDEGPELALTTERVVVFKDGFALVVKTGVARSDDRGEVFTEDVPDAAVLGTFWAIPAAGRLLAMDAGLVEVKDETTEARPCDQYVELLRANLGKKASVELDGDAVVRGVIREVLGPEVMRPEVDPSRSFRPPSPVDGRVREVATIAATLFALDTDDGVIVLPVSRIRRLTVRDMALTLDRKVVETRNTKRLTFRFEGGAARRELRLLYFRPGVRWIPTYRVSLEGRGAAAKQAGIELQAEILNEAEDLEEVRIDLVVGVPSFRFKEVVSPFVLERELRHALRQAAPQLMGQQALASNFSNAMFNTRAGESQGPPAGEGTGGLLDLPEDLTAGRSQDLFVYHLPRSTIRQGHRAAVPVFSARVPYRDVYTWDLHLTRPDIEGAPSGAHASPLVLSTNRVWHMVELTNGTDVPWTTGAALALEGDQPLGQDLLTYTPPGAAVQVPVTVNVDLRGEFSEEETGRELRAIEWERRSYARIRKRGALSLENRTGRAVDVEITCRLGGLATVASEGGSILVDAFDKDDWKSYMGHPAVNNSSTVRWSVRLEPGKTFGPTVDFHYYARD